MLILPHPGIKSSLSFFNNNFHPPKPAHMADSSNSFFRYMKEENFKSNSILMDINLQPWRLLSYHPNNSRLA